ncbi:MAG: serine hydrolase [Pyrinomonadaceae bacterium]
MKSRAKFWLLAVFFAALASLPVSYAQESPLNGFDDYVRKAMKEWEVPGLAIAVVKDDKVVFSKTYGVRKLGDPTPVDERTMFAIASCTKAFTAAALAMLVDEGKLKWDDPVIKHMPDFQLYDPWMTREITVRDLLTHRSGLAGPEPLWYSFGLEREEILRRLRYEKPVTSMRTRFSYNNPLYMAAGQLIPRLTGQSYDDFVRQRIFEPLGMTSSNMSITALKGSDNISTPYAKLDGKIQPVEWHSVDNMAPAGSINSNLKDLVQWLRLQLNGGTFNGRQLISPGAYQEMHRSQIIIRFAGEGPAEEFSKGLKPDSHFFTTGFGWNLYDYRGHVIDEHGGNINGQSAEIAMMPDLHLGFILLSNMNNSFMRTPLMYRIFDAYLGAPPRDWSAEMHTHVTTFFEKIEAERKRLDAQRVQGTSPSLTLEKYVGTFRSDLFGDLNITLEANKLVLRFGKPQWQSDLEHWQYDTFKAHWDDPLVREGKVTFVLTPQGKADEVRFDMTGGANYPFKRIADAGGGNRGAAGSRGEH